MAINGRPRHSQSQGLVERGNRTAEQKLQAQKKITLQGDSYPWASWLPRIMWAMNCQSHETIRDSPYHLVFCKQPPDSVFPGAQQNCMAEEDISSDVQINEIYDDLGSDVQHSDNELVPTQPQAATKKTMRPQAQEDDNTTAIGASTPQQQPVPTPTERVFKTLSEIAQDNNPTTWRRCAIRKRALDSTFTATTV